MAKQVETCPICGEGHLEAHVDKNVVEYKGQTAELDAHYSVCSECGSEQANAAQTRTNKRAINSYKKQVDGLLTGSEIRALREYWGITQSDATAIFGGGPVAFSKYESDDVAQSEAMDKLLRLAKEVPQAFAHLAHQAGIQTGQGKKAETSWVTQDMVRPTAKASHLRVVYSSVEQKGQWEKCA